MVNGYLLYECIYPRQYFEILWKYAIQLYSNPNFCIYFISTPNINLDLLYLSIVFAFVTFFPIYDKLSFVSKYSFCRFMVFDVGYFPILGAQSNTKHKML